MVTLGTVTQTSLLRNLSVTQTQLSKAYARLAGGTRIVSAADDPAGRVLANSLRAELGGVSGHLANATRLTGMIDAASGGIQAQVGLLQDMRTVAVAAAQETSSTVRASYQTEMSALAGDFDRAATTTTYNGRFLLDGTVSNQTWSLGGLGAPTVALSLPNTRSTAVGNIAEAVGTATVAALVAGDLTVNGVDVGATSGADDAVSSSGNSQSAIALAAAINRADAGVSAELQATELNLGTVSAGTFTAGDLVINAQDIGAVTTTANDAGGDLLQAINAVSAATGVTAALNDAQELVLTAADGRNIVTSGADTDGTGVLATDPGAATYTGSVVLTSSTDIVIAGSNPGSAGLAAGTSYVGSHSVATLDVSSQAAADSALRRIDAALAELDAVSAALGVAANQVDAAVGSLHTQQAHLSASLGQTLDADVAGETARLSAASFSFQTQITLLAQANVQSGWVLDLIPNPL